jgi:hypothetical protein
MPEHALFVWVGAAVTPVQRALSFLTPHSDWSQPENIIATMWLAAAVLSLFSVLNLFLLHRLTRALGATEAEAKDYYQHVIHEQGDLVAAGNLLDTFTAESGSQLPDPALRESYLRNMMAGYSGFPVVGTASSIADFLQAMADCGMAGATLSWPDYASGLKHLERDLLPELQTRGLRQAAG